VGVQAVPLSQRRKRKKKGEKKRWDVLGPSKGKNKKKKKKPSPRVLFPTRQREEGEKGGEVVGESRRRKTKNGILT